MTHKFLFFLQILALGVFTYDCASDQATKRNLIDRSGTIAAKIFEAEILGAKDYAPRELARAQVALERARHEASQSYNHLSWIDVEFDKAEIAANELLARRNLNATH